ncbi:alpha/beta hydrolase [uncultured Planktomarina sp.]|uniref:alpha/beta fold hydrolase n=1 Tax=uncultured Planktomarina sp. TaxID=1538529 RepID=UPI00326096CA
MSARWADLGLLEAGGNALEYGCLGPATAEAPTVVLLHEGLGSRDLWRDFPARLSTATGWGVCAYSRAGYGGSDLAVLPRPLDYMTREARVVLPEVLNAIGFERGLLMGHSDGATIAAIYAGTVQDPRLRGLVTIAPHFFTEEIGLREIARAQQAFDSGDLRSRLAKYHGDPDNCFRGWNDVWLHPEFKNWNVSQALEDIGVPVLAIQGAEDQYGTLAQIDEVERRCPAPVERVVLPGCGHDPCYERPDRVLMELMRFCADLDPSGVTPGLGS